MEDETAALQAELAALQQENQGLKDSTSCDHVQEEVLTKFEAALQPLYQKVASGGYNNSKDALERDLAALQSDHITEYNKGTAQFAKDAVDSQRQDLLHDMAALLRRITLLGVESRLESLLAEKTDEILRAVALEAGSVENASPPHSYLQSLHNLKTSVSHSSQDQQTQAQPKRISLWPRLIAIWERASADLLKSTEEQLGRLGCAAKHAAHDPRQISELRTVAHATVAKRIVPVSRILPEMLRTTFETAFRLDSTGVPRVVGSFTDLEGPFAIAMGRVGAILDEFTDRSLLACLPMPATIPDVAPAKKPNCAEENVSVALPEPQPGWSDPLVDWRERDRLVREVRAYADELFEAQKTKQMLLRGASDFPLWALLFMVYVGGDHFLATLLSPFKLFVIVFLLGSVAALLMLHRIGVLPPKAASLLDTALPVLTMGVFNGMQWGKFYQVLRQDKDDSDVDLEGGGGHAGSPTRGASVEMNTIMGNVTSSPAGERR